MRWRLIGCRGQEVGRFRRRLSVVWWEVRRGSGIRVRRLRRSHRGIITAFVARRTGRIRVVTRVVSGNTAMIRSISCIRPNLVRARFLHHEAGTSSAAAYADASAVCAAAATSGHWSTGGYTYLQMARRYPYPCRPCGDNDGGAKAATGRRRRVVRVRWLRRRRA